MDKEINPDNVLLLAHYAKVEAEYKAKIKAWLNEKDKAVACKLGNDVIKFEDSSDINPLYLRIWWLECELKDSLELYNELARMVLGNKYQPIDKDKI